MTIFERYLSLWVALCIVAGVALGHFLPGVFHAIGAMEVAKVNLPVAALIWLMITPMLMKIDFAALAEVGRHWRGIGVTLAVNWAVKPFSMALLGWIFIGYLFRPYLPADQIELLYRRPDPARSRALHRHGVRVVESHQGRAAFHAESGRAQRRNHDRRFRAHRRVAAWTVLDRRAVGHAVSLGGSLHRRSGDRRAARPQTAARGRR